MVLLVAGFQLGSRTSLRADDWPQFLGPDRNGVSAETGLISEWPAEGPKIVWRTPLGVSMSGIAIVGDRLYTMFQDDVKQFAVCLNANTGDEHWRTSFAPLYENGMGNGPRATPAVRGDTVVCFTGEGILAAFDAATGRQAWSVNVPESLGGAPADYGVSCSPVIVGDVVIVHTGAEAAATAAFRLSDGRMAWTSGTGKSGYASPVLMELAGTQQLVTFTASGAASLNPETGEELWSFPFVTEYDCNTSNPVRISDDSVLISAGEDHGSVLLQVTQSAGQWSATPVWESAGKSSQLRAEWQTPVVHDGHLFGLDNSGSAGPIVNLVCLRLSDRQTVWMQRRFGKSNFILADGKLFFTTMNGEVGIIEATPSGFKELSRATIMETTRQAPAIASGRLYVRDDKEVICVDVRAK
jgi:outer membrane protein assembly factor BamB